MRKGGNEERWERGKVGTRLLISSDDSGKEGFSYLVRKGGKEGFRSLARKVGRRVSGDSEEGEKERL